jgi:hypothetical protein
MSLRIVAGVCVVLFIGVAQGVASPIFVADPSFENPLCVGPAPNSTCPPPGWTVDQTAGLGGGFLPVMGPSGAWDYVPDGTQVGWSNGAVLTQLLTATIDPFTTYTLGLWVSQRYTAGTFQPEIELIGGSTVLFKMSNANPGGAAPTQPVDSTYNWVFWDMSWTSPTTGPLIGQALTISLASDGIQTDFDNVSLNAALAPEPGTIVLLGASLLGLVVRRRFAK